MSCLLRRRLGARFDVGVHLDDAQAVARLHATCADRVLVLGVLAAAQRQRDGGDDRHQQDHRGDLERVDVLGVDHAAELLGVAVARAAASATGASCTSSRKPRHSTARHLEHDDRADAARQRQVAPEALAQLSMLMSSIITTNRNSTITAPT